MLKALLPALAATAMVSCSAKPRQTDPLTDLRNPSLSVPAREQAIDRAWRMAQEGTLDRIAVREDLKTVAWSRHWALPLRQAAIARLLSDTDERGREDTRNMVRLMLPRESEPAVTTVLSAAAEKNGWKETTPALVRSLSVEWIGVADRERPEAAALRKLNPAESLEGVVYRVFRDPPDDGGPFGLVPPDKIRSDAWNVLRRLDPDGTVRWALVSEDSGGVVDDLRAAMNELKVLPDTGEELTWLTSLRSGRTPAHREWWTGAASAVGKLSGEQSVRLRIRHLEPLRWASEHRPEWTAASFDQLYAQLESRLADRKTYRRSATEPGEVKTRSERLPDWKRTLSWGDLLAILVIDEAVRQQGVPAALFSQAAMDKDDRTAEYGGLLRAEPNGTFAVVLYPPRPGTRKSDTEFVASSDMFAQGDHSIAHYHFHAQDSRNSAYAGPSRGDLQYAARFGRTCLVFTWVSTRSLNVDVFTPEGAVIDLGVVAKP